MKRRAFITLLGGAGRVAARGARAAARPSFGLAWTPLATNAQQTDKLPRLGWLGNLAATVPTYDGFRQGLRELGYAEGTNIIIEARWAEGNLDRLPELARELARLNVNVMFVTGDQGLRAAKEATLTIPIVVIACDPLDSLVASIARPVGKATGLTCISSDLASKRLQLLKELVPALARVAVLFNPEDRNKAAEYKQTQEAARSLQLTAHAFEARSATEIDRAFAGMVGEHAQGLVIFADALMVFHEKKLADLALQNRLPAIFGFREFAEVGGLISYGANLREQYRRAAWYLDKILSNRHRTRHLLNQEFMQALLLNFRHQGKKAIEKVARNQPAAYLKILALLVPRETKVEHSGGVIKAMTDEQIEQTIEAIQNMLAAQAGEATKVIEGTAEPAALPAPEAQSIGAGLEPKRQRRPNRLVMQADTAVGPRERMPRKRKVPSPTSA
jgi:putative ABC transport system substrate-binding protein